MTIVIEPRRSLAAAVMAGLAACAVGAMGVALVLDPVVPSYSKAPIAVVAAVLIAGIGAVLLRLAAGRGGIVVDEAGGRLGLGVTSVGDTWWLALDACAGVRVAPMAVAGSSIERWLVVVEPRDATRPAIVVAENDLRELVEQVAEAIARRSGLPLLDAESTRPPPPPPVAGADDPRFGHGFVRTFAVARGAALQAILTLFGAALATVGVVAFAGLEQDPILGFIFGPVLFVLGVTLLVIALVKALAREELGYDGRAFMHRFRLGRVRWGTRRVHATAPVWRIWLLGMRGGYLELSGDDGALIMGAGATTLSRQALDDLARLPAHFAAASGPKP